ncbi:exonuclease SbcCD subunit D [Lutispora sp.]|uniref:exonuclease SbcCD subunit D n=1 Tax=Lutispora sp. TaxID=2828727 RepID=UPI002B1FC283|nr:exonuclease SbcCD subunit D [Lutispora sp.]
MKIIHTGDWHIGKIVNEYHMTRDQEYILDQFLHIVLEEKPNAIIIAGDIYDRSVAPVEAVELLDKILGKIVLEHGIPVLAVAGNHDSPERLNFGSGILKTKGLYIEGLLKKDATKITLNDEYGPVNFYLLPYADAAVVRDIFEDPGIRSQQDAMKAMIERIGAAMDKDERNIMITHGYVRGSEEPETSESERPLSIGGTDMVSYELFNDFCYTALGHLHSPQRAGNENIRYSGSLLKYSFSEVKQRKGVNIINIDEKGIADIAFRELVPMRDMRIIRGELKHLTDPVVYNAANREDYIKAILTDKGELLDPMRKLKSVYPNVMLLEVEDRGSKGDYFLSAKTSRNKSKLELFSEFYKYINDTELAQESSGVLAKIIEEVEKRGEDLEAN